MAAINAAKPMYLCHFCTKEFSTRSTLLAHFDQCQTKNCKSSDEKSNLENDLLKSFELNQTEKTILHLLHLQHINDHSVTNEQSAKISNNIDEYLHFSLTNLHSRGFCSSFQSSFDDTFCSTDFSSNFSIDKDEEETLPATILNNKSTCYHIYKYSRRERRFFYDGIRRVMMKKHVAPNKSNRVETSNPLIFHHRHFLIQIPTKIYSRQQISSSTNSIYPLLFDEHFHELIKVPEENLFDRYLNEMKIFFHLIHSIASQEFQFLMTNSDHQHQFSYTNYSLIHLLRQTMFESTTNLKRNYFQSFPEGDLSLHPDQESFIPPLKIRRYDHSSYEIKDRSTSSTASSSSSGTSIIQINQTQQYLDDRRRSETRSKKLQGKFSDQQINSNSSSNSILVPTHHHNDQERKDLSELSMETSLLDQQHFSQSNESEIFSTSSLTMDLNGGEAKKRRKSPSPNVIREQSNDVQPKYQSVALNDGARIRIVNCSNDNSKYPPTRNSNSSSTKRSSQPMDENWTRKTARVTTRKISSTNSKTSEIAEVSPPSETQSVLLTNNEIAHGWLTHNVFYRCHVCLHEEFFVVLSRECMILHISSKHGNMEENFKQRISNSLNNQGRALKIFQHFLKWQQPWSEKEIDQIFRLANSSPQTNGSL